MQRSEFEISIRGDGLPGSEAEAFGRMAVIVCVNFEPAQCFQEVGCGPVDPSCYAAGWTALWIRTARRLVRRFCQSDSALIALELKRRNMSRCR